MSKFKVGDMVKIIDDPTGIHLNRVTNIIAVKGKNLYELEDSQYMWEDEELELVESVDNTNSTDTTDTIHNPLHYQLNGLDIESIDIIKSILGKEGFYNFCYGNVIKYIIRADKKNGIEDIKKAQKYISWMLE